MAATGEAFLRLQQRIEACAECPRLVGWRRDAARDSGYWSKPVPSFGTPGARLLILGLAPGAHGANRTGRPFTGDGAGQILYRALFEAGLANRPESRSRDDGLRLDGVLISNAVRCVPPGNKPSTAELAACSRWLSDEIALLPNLETVFALGKVAHDAFLSWARAATPALRRKDFPFVHGLARGLPAPLPRLVDSYHPSRYNIHVGKLTYAMFLEALRTALGAAEINPPAGPPSRRRSAGPHRQGRD